jgi:hypothetical protein
MLKYAVYDKYGNPTGTLTDQFLFDSIEEGRSAAEYLLMRYPAAGPYTIAEISVAATISVPALAAAA